MKTVLQASLIVLGIATLLVLSGTFYTLEEGQQAVIVQFGRPVGEPVTAAGLHVKLPFVQGVRRVGRRELLAFGKTLWRQLPSRQGPAYARFLARVLRHRPRLFPEAVRFAIEGYHFEKVTRQVVTG
ncbi:MAG: DUF4070 domain-containing protein [Thermodesulfobacteriota bacterium]